MNRQSSTAFLTLTALMVVAIWGETFVSSKILLNNGMMPADIFFYRFTLAYLCLAAISHKRMWADSLRQELKLAAAGIFGGTMYFLCENMALKFSTASNVAILVGLSPMITAFLLSIFYKDERMGRKQIMGSAAAFIGTVLVILNGQLILHLNPLGDALAIGAALCWGFYSLCMKGLSERYDVRFITRKVFGYGVISILPWFLFIQPLQTDIHILSIPSVWMNLVYLGAVASLLCFLVWNWVLPRLGVVKATNIVYSQCAFTMVVSAIVLGERITWMAILGTVILIGGMALMNKNK